MKKGQFLLVALCASAMVLGGCGTSSGKKKTSSSSSSAQPTTSSDPTSSSSTSEAPVVVNVESVTLDPSSLARNIGDKEVKLKATVLPENATNKNVSWSSDNPSVAKVEGGLVSFLAEGTATITVTTQDGNKTAQCPVTVSEPWSAADLQIFADHIYGVRVPYLEVEGAEVAYDSESNSVVYGTPDSVLEPNCTPEILDAYAALFPDEWEMEADIDEDLGTYAYSGMLSVSVTIAEEETVRFVQADLYAVDDEGYESEDGNGFFCLDLYDPYFYSWSEFEPELAYYVDELFEAEPLFPEFTGTVFCFESDLSGLDYYGAYMFYVNDTDSTSANAYIDAFKADTTNWVDDGIDEYEFHVFHRVDEKFEVLLSYTAYTDGSGLGYIRCIVEQYVPTYDTWAGVQAKVDEYIAAVNSTGSTVPAFDGGVGAIYRFYDTGEGYGQVVIEEGENVTQAKVDEYVADLSSNPTVINVKTTSYSTQSVTNFEDKAHGYEALVTYVAESAQGEDDDYVLINVYPSLQPYTEFPSSQVATYLESISVTAAALPAAFSGASEDIYFNVQTSAAGCSVIVHNATLEEVNTYLGALPEWEKNPVSGNYVHSSGDAKIIVYDYIEQYGYVGLLFAVKAAAWEQAEIDAFKEALHGIVPVFTDAGLDYDYTKDGVFYSLDMSAAEVTNYGAALVDPEAGWTYIEHVSGSPTYYKASEDGEGYAVMTFYPNGDKYYFYLRFSSDQPVADPTAWTEEQLAALDFETRLHGLVPPFVYANLSWSEDYSQYGASVSQAIGMNYIEYLSTPANGWTEISGGFAKEVSDASGYVVIEIDDTYLDYYGIYLIYIYYVAYSE